jgi:CubicO group peptidase (beta-lactamase class C family)
LTPADLLTFVEALVGGTLISPEMQAEMRTVVHGEDLSEFGLVHRYGLGIEQYSNDTVTVVGHLGSGHVHSAFIGYDAERGNALVVTMNTDTPGPQALTGLETLMALASA